MPDSRCKLGLLAWFALTGCVVGLDEGAASEPADESPLAPAAVGRWTPLNEEPTVCAWRGAVFSPADFEAVPAPDGDDACVNFAQCAWEVEAGDEPRIFIQGSFPTPSLLPFEPPSWGQTRSPPDAVHRVEDGWLLGYDSGEWGGSVWWYSVDGSTSRQISDEKAMAFFERGDAVWALGNAGRDYDGQVLVLSNDPTAGWQVEIGPQAMKGVLAATLDGETILVASLDAVEAIEASGEVRVLAEVDWLRRWPTSIARMSDGTILVGTTHGVTRLTPNAAGGYVEDFLIPPPCRVGGFMPGHLDCACAGLEPEGFSFDSEVVNQSGPSF